MNERTNKLAGVAFISLLFIFGVWFNSFPARAQTEAALERFYVDCVDKKIAQCEQKAKLVDSKGKHCCADGEKAVEQLRFYQDRKEDLVQAMVLQNIGTKQYKVDLFLNQAYMNSNRMRIGGKR